MIFPFDDSTYRIELNRPFPYSNPFSLSPFYIEQTNDNTPSFENLFSEEEKKMSKSELLVSFLLMINSIIVKIFQIHLVFLFNV